MERVASIASIPERSEGLRAVVLKLLPQVDKLNVYLNGFYNAPFWLRDERIEVACSQDHGDRGGAGKLFWADKLKRCIHLTLDDDIDYPTDYVSAMVACLARNAGCAVGVHSALFHENATDYFAGRSVTHHFTAALPVDTPVHMIGVGTMAYMTEDLVLDPAGFNGWSEDARVAVEAKRQGVKLIAIQRCAQWLKGTPFESIRAVGSSLVQQAERSAHVNALVASGRPWR